MTYWPPRKRPSFDGVPELSPEEVEHRLDVGARVPAEPRSPWIGGDPTDVTPGDAPQWATDLDDDPGLELTRVTRDDAVDDVGDRRRILWRDSAMILSGLILAILAAQTFLPGSAGVPTGSPTAFPTGVAIGSLQPPISLPPGVTFGPIIDPSLGIDATPTPIPVITLGPTAPPTPRALPTPRASATPTKTPKPSPKPSTPKPQTPAPTASPNANFTFNVDLLVASFTNLSTGDTSWEWDFGDLTTSTAKDPAPHVYASAGTYTVRLTINGESNLFEEQAVTVLDPTPGP